MSRNFIGLLFGVFAFTACANISPQERRQYAADLAAAHGWEPLRLPTEKFVMVAYVPKFIPQSDVLTVYVEGDGLAWLSESQASDDSTPRNPVGLKLALHHPQGAAAYLARPCQYVGAGDARGCQQSYWTSQRFAPEVIEASDQAVSMLEHRFDAHKLVLVGYSGGGAVATLIAARRKDVVLLITVAGNLDHRTWTEEHLLSPLTGSLNPADEWQSLVDIPQLHFVGARDTVVSRDVLDAYASRFPPGHRPMVISVPGFDHTCCWVDKWGTLLSGQGDARSYLH